MIYIGITGFVFGAFAGFVFGLLLTSRRELDLIDRYYDLFREYPKK